MLLHICTYVWVFVCFWWLEKHLEISIFLRPHWRYNPIWSGNTQELQNIYRRKLMNVWSKLSINPPNEVIKGCHPYRDEWQTVENPLCSMAVCLVSMVAYISGIMNQESRTEKFSFRSSIQWTVRLKVDDGPKCWTGHAHIMHHMTSWYNNVYLSMLICRYLFTSTRHNGHTLNWRWKKSRHHQNQPPSAASSCTKFHKNPANSCWRPVCMLGRFDSICWRSSRQLSDRKKQS